MYISLSWRPCANIEKLPDSSFFGKEPYGALKELPIDSLSDQCLHPLPLDQTRE
jgi:hypothetical protein